MPNSLLRNHLAVSCGMPLTQGPYSYIGIPTCRMKYRVSPKLYRRRMHEGLSPRVRLVVEEPSVLLYESDAQLLCRLEDGTVVLAASRRSNVLGT